MALKTLSLPMSKSFTYDPINRVNRLTQSGSGVSDKRVDMVTQLWLTTLGTMMLPTASLKLLPRMAPAPTPTTTQTSDYKHAPTASYLMKPIATTLMATAPILATTLQLIIDYSQTVLTTMSTTTRATVPNAPLLLLVK